MSDNDVAKVSEAAAAVMAALQPLNSEERARVIQSMAALFGLSAPQVAKPQQVHPPAGSGTREHEGQGAGDGNKRMSLVELIKEKQPATNAQRIACFAYYRDKYESTPNFASSDLAAYFGKAKLAAPGKNYSRDYNNAVKEAWIHDEGAQSYLTQGGERAVEAGFGGKAKPRGATAGKRRRKAGKSE